MTTPVSNNSNGTVYGIDSLTAQGTSANGTENKLDKDTFLKLLVAQLKYQDPLKPADAQSFMAQTAQFTQVEKLEEMNDQLKAQATSTGLSTASALLGKTITFALDDGTTATGVVSSVKSAETGVSLDVGSRETTLDKVTQIANTTTGS